jgi:pimeloyl-ACP methyl ester carboxylesterase
LGVAVATALGALVGVFGLLPAVLANRLLHPPRRKLRRTPAALGLSYEPVTFAGRGVKLAGWYVPSHGDAAVVLVHGFGRERTQLLSLVPALHAAGYHTLLYDMRARGTSGGDAVTFGHYEADDLAAAAAYLRARSGARRVAAIGVSLGAAVSVLAAARGADLDAVVADSAFADLRALVDEGTPVRLFAVGALAGPLWRRVGRLVLWHAERWSGLRAAAVRPVDAAGQIGRPVLFIHGMADRLFGHHHSIALHAATGHPSELWLVPEADHVGAYDRDPAEYTRRILAFLAGALPTAPAEPLVVVEPAARLLASAA